VTESSSDLFAGYDILTAEAASSPIVAEGRVDGALVGRFGLHRRQLVEEHVVVGNSELFRCKRISKMKVAKDGADIYGAAKLLECKSLRTGGCCRSPALDRRAQG